jgi:hypothetical protein
MLYVDKLDRSIRWEAFVRRKFGNGVWLWAAGPACGWQRPEEHHAYCCTDNCNLWRSTQHNSVSHVVLPITNHLRCALWRTCLHF